jgi:hypothetical protein
VKSPRGNGKTRDIFTQTNDRTDQRTMPACHFAFVSSSRKCLQNSSFTFSSSQSPTHCAVSSDADATSGQSGLQQKLFVQFLQTNGARRTDLGLRTPQIHHLLPNGPAPGLGLGQLALESALPSRPQRNSSVSIRLVVLSIRCGVATNPTQPSRVVEFIIVWM